MIEIFDVHPYPHPSGNKVGPPNVVICSTLSGVLLPEDSSTRNPLWGGELLRAWKLLSRQVVLNNRQMLRSNPLPFNHSGISSECKRESRMTSINGSKTFTGSIGQGAMEIGLASYLFLQFQVGGG